MIVTDRDGDRLRIMLYFDIGAGGTRAAEVAEAIAGNPDTSAVEVRINSYGGEVADGWAMYNALKSCGKQVTTYNDGFCCSAAVYPFLAGAKRVMHDTSAIFLHDCMGGCYGYADDLKRTAEELDKLTAIGINAFVESAGLDVAEVAAMMAAETWLDADTALQKGICTKIAGSAPTGGTTQDARSAVKNRLFGAAPKNKIRALWGV